MKKMIKLVLIVSLMLPLVTKLGANIELSATNNRCDDILHVGSSANFVDRNLNYHAFRVDAISGDYVWNNNLGAWIHAQYLYEEGFGRWVDQILYVGEYFTIQPLYPFSSFKIHGISVYDNRVLVGFGWDGPYYWVNAAYMTEEMGEGGLYPRYCI